MLTDSELTALLNDIESDRSERKESLSDAGKIRQAICAFANDLPNHGLPGIIFIGAKDNGESSGLSITDELLRTLSDMRSDGNILPFPTLTVNKRILKGVPMGVVEVFPSHTPPVRYNGRVWIRVGPRRATATPGDERILSEKRRNKDIPFDARPVERADIDTLDEQLFRRVYLPAAVAQDVLQQNQRTYEDQLLASKFLFPGKPQVPTIVGVLAVGSNPTEWIPCAYVQFIRFEGTTVTDPIKSSLEIPGPIPEAMEQLDELLKVNIQTARDVTSSNTDIPMPDYPLVALQQLMRNAVLHRTYENTNAPVHIRWFSDRVEIQNPGGPFGQVTRQNFGMRGAYDYRNPHLAAVMKELGYVQRFGMGIEMARKSLDDNGNPPPEFESTDTSIIVTIRRVA